MRNKIIFLLIISALILTSGCIESSEILPLNEEVEEINGIYPTMSACDSQYMITRGIIREVPTLVRDNSHTCGDEWLILFDDGKILTIRGLECRSVQVGAVNRITTTFKGKVTEVTFK